MSYPINTIQDFYQWVKTRDPSEEYNYYDATDCARARYCHDRGLSYKTTDAFDKSPIEEAAQQNHQPGAEKSRPMSMENLRKEIEDFFLHETEDA